MSLVQFPGSSPPPPPPPEPAGPSVAELARRIDELASQLDALTRAAQPPPVHVHPATSPTPDVHVQSPEVRVSPTPVTINPSIDWPEPRRCTTTVHRDRTGKIASLTQEWA